MSAASSVRVERCRAARSSAARTASASLVEGSRLRPDRTGERGAPGIRRFWLAFAGIALVAVLAYLHVARAGIAAWSFPDPDDQMRLQEVRDFLAGQAWSDVSQHRMNAPWGAGMHWSRLIDLPIAGIIVALRPLLGAAGAERIALIAVPLATLVASMAMAALLARRLSGPIAGLAAAALLPVTTGAMQQMQPLRIDHHGWQVTIAVGMAFVLVGRGRRAGEAAGALAALWLSISLEGLPFCAAAGALLALRWLADPIGDDDRFAGFAGALALGSAALFALTKPPGDWAVPACDAVSPLHLIVFGAAALGTLAATRARLPLPGRAAALAMIGALCAALYAGIAPICLKGAFAQLDPLTMRYWYANVREGLPIWRLSWDVGAGAVGFPLLALAGAWLGWRARSGADRAHWLDYVALLAAATIVAACVQRAGAVANALALPAGVVLMASALARAQRLRATLPRVLASAAALVPLLPTAPALAVAALEARTAAASSPPAAPACATTADFATAAALPPGIALTNIDIGPGILVTTPHRVVASSHHRNRAGLHDVLAVFLGPAAQAHRIVARRGVDYLIVCADMAEMDVYRRAAPRGFWAGLAAGRVPGWLRPVHLPGSRLSVWRVIA